MQDGHLSMSADNYTKTNSRLSGRGPQWAFVSEIINLKYYMKVEMKYFKIDLI